MEMGAQKLQGSISLPYLSYIFVSWAGVGGGRGRGEHVYLAGESSFVATAGTPVFSIIFLA